MRTFARSAMCALALAAGAGAGACASLSRPQPEYLPDGSFRLKCNTGLPACLERAEEVCRGTRYTVLGAVDQHDYSGGHGPSESEQRSSRAVVKCGSRGRTLFGPEEDPLPVLATVDKPAAPVAPPTAKACVPGVTQACTGPGACAGGQACLPDGSGFSVCDCGGTPAGAAVSPATGAPGGAAASSPPPSSPAVAPTP